MPRALMLLLSACCLLAAADPLPGADAHCGPLLAGALDELAALAAETRGLAATAAEHAERAKLLAANETPDISFMVSVNETAAYEQFGRVDFYDVITNTGGGWNEENKAFVCPVSGVYYLHLAVFGAEPHDLYVRIVKEGEALAGWRKDAGNNDSSANAVTISCLFREHVYVVAKRASTVAGREDRTTVLSGFLVRQF